MLGPRQVDQAALFYEFSIEGHIPADHMLRAIDPLSICRQFEESWPVFTVTRAGHRLILN